MSWEADDLDPVERARRLIDGAGVRRELKRGAAWVEAHGSSALRAALLDEGRRRGADLPDHAVDWPAKKLLRRARGAEAEARVRTNPIRRDEAFDCAHCGASIDPHGRTARDHCPRCLRSLHVDVVPGDRAAGCGGLLDPVRVALVGGHPILHYRCRQCGAERTNQAILDGHDPDDWARISRLSAGEAV